MRWFGSILVVLALANCRSLRQPATCDPTPTASHSALAWGPARPDDSTEPRGRVVDARTGAPLRDAYITIEPGRRTLATDSLGLFRIPKLTVGTYQVRVRRIGYAEVRDSVKYGMSGLRLFAALAPELGIIDFACTVPAR